MERTIFTHCHYCMCLCGLRITVDGDRISSIEPDRDNPYSWRDFCRKGKTADHVRNHPLRIQTPMRRVGDRYVPASYEEAVEDIAARLKRIIDAHGADAVGTYHGNPLGFSFANSIFFGALLDALGTGNRYWVGSIDQNNTHVVQEAMYGSELISLPADVDECKCFLLIGMDPALSKFGWVDVIPNGWNRMLEAKARGADVIVVDPRHSETARHADTHVAILPGQDWAFLLGLLHVIFSEGIEQRDTATPLNGVDVVRTLALEAPLDELSRRCGIPVDTIRNVARRFAAAPTAVCITHTGVSQTEAGTIGEWLGHVLNAVTNRLDVAGGKRFERSYVDLPAVFGKFAPPTRHHTRLCDRPAIAGFHALTELADEITTPGPGKIRAMLIAGGNPVVSGPDGDILDKAFAGLDLLVAVDLVQRESHRHAHWLIPGTHWLERSGLHALVAGLMDAPFAQFAPRVVPPPAGIKEEWEFFIDLALAMKRPLFGKKGINSLVRASRALARWTGRPGLAMNPGWIERALVFSGRRLKYRDILAHPHGWLFDRKRYGDLASALRTADKTVHCAPPLFVAECRRLLAEEARAQTADYPLLLVNRRSLESMNSWLNETPGLFEMHRSNAVEIHPDDAARLGLEEGMPARVSSAAGSVELPVAFVENGRPGVVTIAHGWGSRIFDPQGGAPAEALGTNRNLLTSRQRVDPLSQMAAFNGTPVRIEPVAAPRAESSAERREYAA